MTSRPGPTRRQFQSCDACRQRRKACDAGYLGIVPNNNAAAGPITSLSSSTNSTTTQTQLSCTACNKKGTKCTFNWLLRHEKRTSIRDLSSSDNRRSGRDNLNRPINHHLPFYADEFAHDRRPDVLTNLSLRSSSDSAPGLITTSDGPLYETGRHDDPSSLHWPTNFSPTEPFSNSGRTSASEGEDGYSMRSANGMYPDTTADVHGYCDMVTDAAESAVTTYRRRTHPHPLNDLRLSRQHEGVTIADSFLHIYRHYLEHAFAGWSSMENSPYVASKKTLVTIHQNTYENVTSQSTTYYDRVIHLDNLASRLEIPNTPRLPPAQHAQATEALHKVILAYASQWSAGHARFPAARGPTDALSSSLHTIMQKTLWHDARLAVAATRHLNTFKTILAQIVFSTIPQPLTDEGIVDPRVATVNPRSCFDGALRDLILWRQQLLVAWQLQTTWTPQQHSLHQAFWNDFGVIYWLAVMCDITYSAVTGFPLVISQRDSAITYWDDDKARPGPGRPVPSAANMHSKRSKEPSGPSLYDTLAVRTKPLDTPFSSWPLTQSQAASLLREAVDLKVFLYERVANLKALTRLAAPPDAREEAIQDALLIYQRWQAIYGVFMDHCTDDWKSLGARLAAWHVVLVGHWHFGALLLGDEIAAVDLGGFGDPSRTQIRAKSMLVGELVVSNARAVAHLARRSVERGPDPHLRQVYSTNLEPWSAMMMHALIKSGATILSACENSCLEFANFVRSRGIATSELVVDVQNVVGALRDFASRCPPAGPAADMLEMRLSALTASPGF